MPVSDDAELTGAYRANILDFYRRYALAIDFGDGSDWADCFTADGRFVANRGEGMDPVAVVTHSTDH
ncbi:MAG TPA: nuclear transport factor 2 family protein [Galbitalea sp.]